MRYVKLTEPLSGNAGVNNIKHLLVNTLKNNRRWIVMISAMLIGVTFILSGSGKLPEQSEFSDALLKSFWTPATSYLVSEVLPWGELALGIVLFTGIFPRIAAILCIPVILGFIANNSWALVNGVGEFSSCASCFGTLEKYLGTISPKGAMIIDIALICLAGVVLAFDKTGFFSFKPWFTRWRKGNYGDATPR